MSKIFLRRAQDPDTYYTQENNPTEERLKIMKSDGSLKTSFLQTCGPTAAMNIVAALSKSDKDFEIICQGGYKPQPEEVLSDYFTDSRNYKKFKKRRSDIEPGDYQGNEIPQYYVDAVLDVFGLNCVFKYGIGFSDIYRAIKGGRGVMLCLKYPGHFIAVVGIEYAEEKIIYNDPWQRNPWPSRLKGTSGFLREMNKNEFESNVKPYMVIIG